MPTFFQDNRMLAWILAGVAFLVAFVLILKIVEIVVDLRRRLPGGSRSRQLRLGFVESFDLDGERQLLLVRRDNLEHLLMIGGPNDVLVEAGIVRVEPREARPPRVAEAAGGVAPPPAPTPTIPHHAAPVEPPPSHEPVVSAPPAPLPAHLAPPAPPPSPAPSLPPHPLLDPALSMTRPPEPETAPLPAPEFIAEPEPAIPTEPPPLAPFVPPAPVSAPPVASQPERPPSRFPLPPRVGPSRPPSFTPSPRFTPPNPAGAGEPGVKPRFVMPPLARRAPPPQPPAEQPPAEPVAAPQQAVPSNAPPPSSPLANMPPLPPLPPFTPPSLPADARPEREPGAHIDSGSEPKAESKPDLDFEPLDSLEEEMAKLLGRPLKK
jgi:flagellar protein FliO/FliZ